MHKTILRSVFKNKFLKKLLFLIEFARILNMKAYKAF